MSIIITNISEDHGIEYGKGRQRYVLKINSKELVEFEHNFNAGLSECLRAAADAFEEMEKGGNMPIWKSKMYDSLMRSMQ